LQGYKDSWFKIPKDLSKAQIGKQIGNSVTVPLVTRLAENCLRALEQSEKSNQTVKRKQRRGVRV